MGVHSTVSISRKEALKAIHAGLDEATDKQLARILSELFGDKSLMNFGVGWDDDDIRVDAIRLLMYLS